MLAAICAGLSAALIAYELTRPHVLSGIVTYDEGVYLGGTLRLLHGALPYRDFAYLPPPGLLLFLSPFVALGHIGGDHGAMVTARILTGAVATANVGLVAYLLRHRGPVAVATAGMAAAVVPAAVAADSTLLIDPFYVFFCLVAAIALFDGSGSFSIKVRRMVLGGAFLGFACAVQLWAAAVVVAMAIAAVVGRVGRRRLGALLGGLVLGAALPSLPFFVLAPGGFVHDVFVVQLARTAERFAAVSTVQRMRIVTGIGLVPGTDIPTAVAVTIVVVLGLLVVALVAMPGRRTLDWFAGAAAVLAVVSVCVSPEFYALYGYFPGIFMVMACGSVAGRVHALVVGARRVRLPRRSWAAVPTRAVGVSALLVVGIPLAFEDAGYADSYLAGAADPGPQLALRIPSGACVASDESTLALNAGRFPTSASCPAMVDPFAQWLADDPHHPAPSAGPYDPSLVGDWSTVLHRADFLVEVAPRSDFIPWTPGLARYVEGNYVEVYSQPGAVLYERTTRLYAP